MNRTLKRLTALTLSLLLAAFMVGCSGDAAPASEPAEASSTATSSQPATSEAEATEAETTQMLDRTGNPYEVPASAEKIISLSPAATEILIELGLAENIIAIDNYSYDVVGIEQVSQDAPIFDMSLPDAELALELAPDIIIASNLSYYEDGNPLQVVVDAGAFVTDIPSATSIEDIRKDILFIGSITGTDEKAAEIVANMDARIDTVVQTIGDNASGLAVYFEMGSDPALYSIGTGTFINEFIETIGAVNIFADQQSWISVSAESIIAANPDVIFTNEGYLEDPVSGIMTRDGFGAVSAVAEERVYEVNYNASSRPSHNIATAIEEMAAAAYPDLF